MSGIPVLTLLTVLPLIGAAIAMFSGKHARGVAIWTTGLSLALALYVWTELPANGSIGLVELHSWAPSLGIDYHLGVDALGALMLVLSAIVTLMSVDAAHRVHHAPGLYFGLVLVLESGLFGSFTALNFFHWFLFWELSLIPAFFLIKLWGGARRGPAATQFFVYTMSGSVALLIAFLAVFRSTGSMDFPHLTLLASTGELEQMVTAHLGPVTMWLAVGVLAGFSVKVPMIPFHTWLPAAYAEAPSPVTMLLTGAMSKMGVYGLLRIAIPLFGHQIAQMRTALLVLAVATVVMGAWAAAAQKDLKRVFAYSSVNHLGYCLLGIFALAVPYVAGDAAQLASQSAALNGVILQMFNHGVTAAALFWFVALMQQRTGGHRGIDDFGGLRKPAPVLAGLMGIALFSSLGLPGLNGFVGEFLIFRGVFSLSWVAATVSILGLLVTAAVILTVIQKVFSGPVPGHCEGFPDLHHGERLALAPVIGLMLLIGLLPQLIVDSVNPTVQNLLAHWRF
ncbi:MAG TPA: NADH-quinone oxidoreductase subunit M [Terracidiphilus sp.]|nr:NADH-quinone oxidoreductase subunit M [Terracidiphilus sp.]